MTARLTGSFLARFFVTLVVVAAACVAGWQLWTVYMVAPWTRDGRVRADVIGVTPDVSGLVSEVLVHDNQVVKAGAVLFRVDRARFDLALRQANAVVASRLAALEEAVREANRYQSLNNVAVSQEKQQQTQTTQQTAAAAYQQSLADRDVAALNLARAEVTAPANGQVTNFDLRPGDYVNAGKAVFAFIDTDTLHIEGYFEETKLDRIHPGDAVRVRLIGSGKVLMGKVESIAGGIEDRERQAGSNLLANVNPTFSWVRLAQRVPVRVALNPGQDTDSLVVGRTASVDVLGW
jgi:RND family efflux transporter MFP subunit